MSKQNPKSKLQTPTLNVEKSLWSQGISYIAGVDEAGCGCWAGPLVYGAVILPKDFKLDGVRDSKTLSEKKREEFYDVITKEAIAWSAGKVTAQEIDSKGLAKAKRVALLRSIYSLGIRPEYILLDGNDQKIEEFPCRAIVKGDRDVFTISCGAIIAKVTRDRIIKNISKDYPGYKFESNKGYGTKDHIEGLDKIGPCGIHRYSYEPIKKYLK